MTDSSWQIKTFNSRTMSYMSSSSNLSFHQGHQMLLIVGCVYTKNVSVLTKENLSPGSNSSGYLSIEHLTLAISRLFNFHTERVRQHYPGKHEKCNFLF